MKIIEYIIKLCHNSAHENPLLLFFSESKVHNPQRINNQPYSARGGTNMNVYLMVLALVIYLGGCTKPESYEEVKTAVAYNFIDPSSATFRNLRTINNGEEVCGEVNAKNRMGGYVGYRRFHASSNSKSPGNWIVDMGDEVKGSYDNMIITNRCGRSGSY
jgi:hypothetical protein